MIANILATLIVLFYLGRMGWLVLQVWYGPYEEKGKFVLISAGEAIAAILILWVVWS